jgi:hypothetical protein
LKPLEFYHLLCCPPPTNLFSKLERHPHDLIKVTTFLQS